MQQYYRPKEISKVDSKGSRVCLVGRIISSDENSFVLDDGTGKIEVISQGSFGKGKLVRVFCSVDDEKLKADIVQDVEGLDLSLFKKINTLYSSGV